MSEKIIVPALGESVTEATVSKWLKSVGEEVSSDEPLVELETDKVNVEVPSPSDGILEKISVKEGTTVEVGSLLGSVGASNSKPVVEKKEKKYTPPPKKEKSIPIYDEEPKKNEEVVELSKPISNGKETLVLNEIEEDEAKELLNKITYLYTPNTEQLLGTINGLSPLMLEKKPTLVVLDGAIGQFREEYLGRGTLAERQMQIARLMTHIKNISFYFRCPVVFTNQVQSDPSMMFGDPIKPIGGNVVAHASTYRIYFKKSGKKRLARMVDSPEHAQADAEYILTEKGLVDPE